MLDRTKPIRNWAHVVSAGAPAGQQIGTDVQDANRVLDEHLRAGEASARLFPGAQAAASMAGESQDVAQRMLRAASDLMSFWFDFMARSGGGVPPGTGAAAAPPPSPVGRPPDASPPVAVEIDSQRPVTVTVQLRPDAAGGTLSLDRLHPRRSGGVPLTGVRIDAPDDGPAVIRLRIDPRQPAGVYDGVVVNEATSLPAGTISVEVRPPRRAPRAKGSR